MLSVYLLSFCREGGKPLFTAHYPKKSVARTILLGFFIFSSPCLANETFATTTPTLQAKLQFQSPEEQVSVLEVYSSQGCSSCPPAQRWVNLFSNNNGLWQTVIPLVFHVDYWDYIGWADPFAKPQFSARQGEYKQVKGLNSVYTPGFILNGREWRGWFAKRSLPSKQTKVGHLSLNINQQSLSLGFAATKNTRDNTQGDNKLELNIALLGFGLRTEVRRGENARKTLRENFVVLEHLRLPFNNDNRQISWPKTFTEAKQYGIVVWLSDKLNLKPLQATGGYIPNSWALLSVDKS
jgi:hypothetical protein